MIVLGDASGLEAIGLEGHDGSLEVIIMKAFHSVKAKVRHLENVVKNNHDSDGLEVIKEDKEKVFTTHAFSIILLKHCVEQLFSMLNQWKKCKFHLFATQTRN